MVLHPAPPWSSYLEAHAAAAALPLTRPTALLRFSYTSVDGIDFWVSRFSGGGGLAGVKEEPPAAGTGLAGEVPHYLF